MGSESYALTPYDALYIPAPHDLRRRARGRLGATSPSCRRRSLGDYPVQYVPFEAVQKDPGLHFRAGGPASARELNILIGKNTQTGRILAGVTFSDPGNWTSWPPHEHAAMLEEAYLYIDMPAPAFAVQLVYTNAAEPELATIVHEGDVVLMPQGYHPNVAAPGSRVGFLWMMAANREGVDRQFGVVNVQPEFAGDGIRARRREGTAEVRQPCMTFDRFNLAGRVALVTGASRGLGAGDGDGARRGRRGHHPARPQRARATPSARSRSGRASAPAA